MRYAAVMLVPVFCIAITGCGPTETSPYKLMQRNDAAALRSLLKSNPKLVNGDRTADVQPGWTPMHFCAMNDTFLNCAKVLLEFSPDLTIQSEGQTPLHVAARTGAIQTTKLLIDAGVDVNATDPKSRYTPLHMAASAGKLETVKLLVEAGAEIDRPAASPSSKTPLDYALRSDRTDVAAYLRSKGAKSAADLSTPGSTQ